jgi:hypothetical protein
MHILEAFMDYRNQLVHCFEILVDWMTHSC